eukprot:CAMPEP_0117741628 /NCGR_PEP_ID=MMETSP0947-20121206/5045_1 /TAXON_ID=44440 /ORGANISM="Chattonella subsalsa, Strain CCMP2191" /LENGTH=185 /DNA_ID=CAMNT_0005557959 /DNA_START=694 /DNA_END=1252 /DNA_ORIENTATION=+
MPPVRYQGLSGSSLDRLVPHASRPVEWSDIAPAPEGGSDNPKLGPQGLTTAFCGAGANEQEGLIPPASLSTDAVALFVLKCHFFRLPGPFAVSDENAEVAVFLILVLQILWECWTTVTKRFQAARECHQRKHPPATVALPEVPGAAGLQPLERGARWHRQRKRRRAILALPKFLDAVRLLGCGET